MRALMALDVDEYDMADLVRDKTAQMNDRQELLLEAWSVMGSAERRAWKALQLHRRPHD